MIDRTKITEAMPLALSAVDVPGLGLKQHGKVRDFYLVGEKRVLITTDRHSAFDVVLGTIPYKGAVLNQLAAWWFDYLSDIVPNHLLSVPDPNVSISRNCEAIPIEMVVRGYLSGSTKTSVWYAYERGERDMYGLQFPDGLVKNDPLPEPVITPTTRGTGPGGKDERMTRDEILKSGIVSKKLYKQMEDVSLRLFRKASAHCAKCGIILVDTKYEFGLCDGELTLIDEVHTPDSSRFWLAETYEARKKAGKEPENYDKEYTRLWYVERGYRGEGSPPAMSQDLVVGTAERYLAIYKKLTGRPLTEFSYPIEERIVQAVQKAMPS